MQIYLEFDVLNFLKHRLMSVEDRLLPKMCWFFFGSVVIYGKNVMEKEVGRLTEASFSTI